MISLNNFKINTSKNNSMDCMRDKKAFIDGFVAQKIFVELIEKFSNYTKIDSNILALKIKKNIFQQFNFKNNCFNNFSSYFQICKEFIFFYYILFITIFKSKKPKTIKTDIILFNVDCFDDIDKFKKLLNNYNHSTIITNKKLNFKNIKKSIQDEYLKENIKIDYKDDILNISYKDKDNSYKINTSINYKHDIILNRDCIENKFSLFKYGFYLLRQSLNEKFNFIKLFNLALFAYVNNFSIFKKYKSKNIIHDRIYSSCSIRNYIFKKMGGIRSACVQSHLAEASINFYNDTDLFFTFGDEHFSKSSLEELGSRIRADHPIGSLRAESYYTNSSLHFHSDKKIDILVVGVNLFNWLYFNKKQKENYYNHLELIKEISLKYSNLNIYLKHHPNNTKDPIEHEILKDSNVNYLKPELNSYSYIKNSKVIFSCSSTMVIEAYGINGRAYFINPKHDNFAFFEKNKFLKEITLSECNEIEELINKIFLDKKLIQNNSDRICLKNDIVSDRIFKKLSIF